MAEYLLWVYFNEFTIITKTRQINEARGKNRLPRPQPSVPICLWKTAQQGSKSFCMHLKSPLEDPDPLDSSKKSQHLILSGKIKPQSHSSWKGSQSISVQSPTQSSFNTESRSRFSGLFQFQKTSKTDCTAFPQNPLHRFIMFIVTFFFLATPNLPIQFMTTFAFLPCTSVRPWLYLLPLGPPTTLPSLQAEQGLYPQPPFTGPLLQPPRSLRASAELTSV